MARFKMVKILLNPQSEVSLEANFRRFCETLSFGIEAVIQPKLSLDDQRAIEILYIIEV